MSASKSEKAALNGRIENERLHRFVWTVARAAVVIYMFFRYGFRTKKLRLKEPTLVLCNHLTEVDMMMAGCAFSKHMYLVAGEHIAARKNFPTLDKYFRPILIYKGDSDVSAIKEIIRRLRAGYSILLFPEGSRSFDGVTMKLPESIGKLVRLGKCGLATYRIKGGYFAEPRWAYTVRKGKFEGEIMSNISREETSKLSASEIADIINRDLYENAYETQREKMQKYKGERLAEGLENYLIICPNCGKYHTIVTRGDRFVCANCGTKGVYNEYGFLEGEELKFDNVRDWGEWEKERFAEDLKARGDKDVIFRFGAVKFYEIMPNHERVTLPQTEITCSKTSLYVGNEKFEFAEISGMAMLYYGKTLLFTYKGRHFGVTGESFKAVGYQWAYDEFVKASADRRPESEVVPASKDLP